MTSMYVSVMTAVLCLIMLWTGLVVGRMQGYEQIMKELRGQKLDWFDRFMTWSVTLMRGRRF